MKTMTCSQMGGMCEHENKGATEHEMMMNGMQHLETAHPEMAAGVKAMAQDDPEMVKWVEKYHADYEATPEDAE